ncbi:hypothetical protein [Amycolatopsis sp. WAC 01416]|uniref:hypothetical protein n=1 Tax=Amycolatopsis sp. WAC 01416 TaxID=2203196 RepID=UPI000F771882|nr:hypothetical protein [Amycolatopsis sp. WAC 01416]
MYAAIDRYRDEAGRSPSTLAVATRLGLANTTFRRNFPDIVAEFAVAKTTAADSAVAADAFTALRKDNARLRLANQEHRASRTRHRHPPHSQRDDRSTPGGREDHSIAPGCRLGPQRHQLGPPVISAGTYVANMGKLISWAAAE